MDEVPRPRAAVERVRRAPLVSLGDLVDLGRRMTGTPDVRAVALVAIDEAGRLVGAEGGVVLTCDGGRLEVLSAEPGWLLDVVATVGSHLWRVIGTGRLCVALTTGEAIPASAPMAFAGIPVVVDRLRSVVAAAAVPGGDARSGRPVTISVGAAGTDVGSLADLVERGERSLRAGRSPGSEQAPTDGAPVDSG